MYWVIQEDIFREEGMKALLEVLERFRLPHSVHKIVPFIRALEPEVAPVGAVIVIGAYTMNYIAKARGWKPGAFLNENFDFRLQHENWGEHLLNADALVTRLCDVPLQDRPFFLRPVVDSKSFAGKVMDWSEFATWRDEVLSASGLAITGGPKPDTEVMVSKVRSIHREARLWVVANRIVTASLYREGGRVRYRELLTGDPLLAYSEARIAEWTPDRAFVLDVCDTDDGPRIVEVNNLNAAGLYHANIAKLVEALESMGYD